MASTETLRLRSSRPGSLTLPRKREPENASAAGALVYSDFTAVFLDY